MVYVAPCSRAPLREHVPLLGRQHTIGYLIIVLVKTISWKHLLGRNLPANARLREVNTLQRYSIIKGPTEELLSMYAGILLSCVPAPIEAC